MSVTLKLLCNGCRATTEGTGRLRKRFHGFYGEDRGFGVWRVDDPEELAPEGWIMFDPYTQVTYCPKCWAEIETETTPDPTERKDA